MRSEGIAAGLVVAVPTVGELPALITLVNALAAEPNFLFINPIDPIEGVAVLRSHLATIATSADQVVLVARAGGDLTGLITGIRGAHPARRGSVEIGLGVRSDCRSHGIGNALLKGLESWARIAGCHRLHLRVTTDNIAAITLYHRYGFSVEGVIRAGALIDGHFYDDLQMAKILVPSH